MTQPHPDASTPSPRSRAKIDRRRLLLAPLAFGAAAIQAKTEAAPDGLWLSRFAQPAGGELDLATFKGRWLLINFWATWCAPCIKELPDFNRFHQGQLARGKAGWQVVGLAVDGPTPVRQFLQRFTPPLTFPIGLAGLNGAELGRSLGNLNGQLPFTVAVNPQGQMAWRRRGLTSFDELESLAKRLG